VHSASTPDTNLLPVAAVVGMLPKSVLAIGAPEPGLDLDVVDGEEVVGAWVVAPDSLEQDLLCSFPLVPELSVYELVA
jgi:hypothetical protein